MQSAELASPLSCLTQAHLRSSGGRAPPASLWLRVSGLRPGAPSLAGARLEVGEELATLLGEGEPARLLAQRLAESPSLPSFVRELRSLVDQLSLQR